MADKKRPTRNADDRDNEEPQQRHVADENHLAGEPERMREVARTRRPAPEDADEFVTDAEMEVREADSSPQDEDDL